jgi:hypothetical protein
MHAPFLQALWPSLQRSHYPCTPVLQIISRYISEKDLAFFKYHAVEDGACEGASAWEKMMDKDVPGFVRYTSWRRTLPSGKTEYKSVTISPHATAREFSDLYLDDGFRCVSGGCK